MEFVVAATRSNDPELHKPGCADIGRGLKTGKYQHEYHINVDTRDEAAEWFWLDFIEEESMSRESAKEYTVFLPCTNGMGEPGPAKLAKAVNKPGRKPGRKAKSPLSAKTVKTIRERKAARETPEPANGKVSKVEAKQDLARRVVLAVSMVFESWDEDGIAAAGMSKADAAQAAANWLHHLPTGTNSDGSRNWPGVLPRPERSDWK